MSKKFDKTVKTVKTDISNNNLQLFWANWCYLASFCYRYLLVSLVSYAHDNKRVDSMIGTVKWYSARLGYGYITDNSNEWIIHYSNIVTDGYKVLSKGQIVSFDIEKFNDNQWHAVNVRVIND